MQSNRYGNTGGAIESVRIKRVMLFKHLLLEPNAKIVWIWRLQIISLRCNVALGILRMSTKGFFYLQKGNVYYKT